MLADDSNVSWTHKCRKTAKQYAAMKQYHNDLACVLLDEAADLLDVESQPTGSDDDGSGDSGASFIDDSDDDSSEEEAAPLRGSRVDLASIVLLLLDAVMNERTAKNNCISWVQRGFVQENFCAASASEGSQNGTDSLLSAACFDTLLKFSVRVKERVVAEGASPHRTADSQVWPAEKTLRFRRSLQQLSAITSILEQATAMATAESTATAAAAAATAAAAARAACVRHDGASLQPEALPGPTTKNLSLFFLEKEQHWQCLQFVLDIFARVQSMTFRLSDTGSLGGKAGSLPLLATKAIASANSNTSLPALPSKNPMAAEAEPTALLEAIFLSSCRMMMNMTNKHGSNCLHLLRLGGLPQIMKFLHRHIPDSSEKPGRESTDICNASSPNEHEANLLELHENSFQFDTLLVVIGVLTNCLEASESWRLRFQSFLPDFLALSIRFITACRLWSEGGAMPDADSSIRSKGVADATAVVATSKGGAASMAMVDVNVLPHATEDDEILPEHLILSAYLCLALGCAAMESQANATLLLDGLGPSRSPAPLMRVMQGFLKLKGEVGLLSVDMLSDVRGAAGRTIGNRFLDGLVDSVFCVHCALTMS